MNSRRRIRALQSILFVSFNQLWERRGLNSIAMGGVTLGVFVLVLMSGILRGFHQKFLDAILAISPHVVLLDTELRPARSMLEQRTTRPVVAEIAHQAPSERQSRITHPYEVCQALREMPNVVSAAASISGNALVDFGNRTRSVELRGIDPTEQEKVTSLSRFMTDGKLAALRTDSAGAVIGSALAEALGVHLTDIIHVSAERGSAIDLRIVGIYESGVPIIDRTRIYTQVRTAQILLGRPNAISRIEVRLVTPEIAPRVATLLENVFAYDAESWQETNANFLSTFKMQDLIVGFVIGALLLVGGFGILSVQVMMVWQKQRDIALLRSIGLRRSDILVIFLLQGLVIALCGGLLGDGLGKVGQHFLGQLKVHLEGGAIKTDTFLVSEVPHIYSYGLAFALLIGVIAAVAPAWRASKVEPIAVLRGLTG